MKVCTTRVTPMVQRTKELALAFTTDYSTTVVALRDDVEAGSEHFSN